MTIQVTPELIARAVEGDMRAFSALQAGPVEQVRARDASLSTWTLTAKAVAGVLSALRGGALSERRAQQWATFVRWGILTTDRHPTTIDTGIDVEFESAHEDAIADALARLDELGDSIDGEIGPEEMDALIATLARGST